MAFARHAVLVLLASVLLASTGCISGSVFRNTTQPLDVNLDATPVHAGGRGTSHKTVVIPYPVRMQFDWGSTAIADGMKSVGMTRAYYADLQTLSILGLWTQRWIHVYGE